MAQPLDDLTGRRFGRLVVFERAENSKSGVTRWRCKCDCGNISETTRKALLEGSSKSCGCYRRDYAKKYNKTHGMKGTRLYRIWSGMKDRTCNPNSKYWERYGGRGIGICEDWKKDFQAFLNWSITNGYKENLTIDRIDVNGNYEPLNCRWVEQKTQQRNRRNNVLITYKNETHCISEWAEILGLSTPCFFYRLKKWKDKEKIFNKNYFNKMKKVNERSKENEQN